MQYGFSFFFGYFINFILYDVFTLFLIEGVLKFFENDRYDYK